MLRRRPTTKSIALLASLLLSTFGRAINFGWTLGELGFHAEAAEALRRALALGPGWDRALANLALVERRVAAPPDRPQAVPAGGGFRRKKEGGLRGDEAP